MKALFNIFGGDRRHWQTCPKGRDFFCPGGTIENSPAFQRWVGRQKVESPAGTAEIGLRTRRKWCGRQVQSHPSSFSRPFGTCVPGGMFPGVKTPGYSQDVPPGQRNAAPGFFAMEGTQPNRDALKGFQINDVLPQDRGPRSAAGQVERIQDTVCVVHPTVSSE
jgi:hypothetical protein